MVEHNKFGKSFGPVGSTAGMVMVAAGLLLIFFHLTAVVLVLIGAFTGFSYSGSSIDFEKKRVRFLNNLFGFIRIGRWLNIESTMKIGIRESTVTWRAYSQGNRSIDVADKSHWILLFNAAGEEIMPLKKVRSGDSANAELESLAKRLILQIASR